MAEVFTSLCLSSGIFPVSFSQCYCLTSSLKSGRRTFPHSPYRPRESGGPSCGDCIPCSSSSQVYEGPAPREGGRTRACGPKSSTCTAGAEVGSADAEASPLTGDGQGRCLTEPCEGPGSCCTSVSRRYIGPCSTPTSAPRSCGRLLRGRRGWCTWSTDPARRASGRPATGGSVGRGPRAGSWTRSWVTGLDWESGLRG